MKDAAFNSSGVRFTETIMVNNKLGFRGNVNPFLLIILIT